MLDKDKKIKVGIIGATGFAGVELVRILLKHPHAELSALGSVSFEGQAISGIYPSLAGLCDLVCTDSQSVIDKSDLVFACVAHGMSQEFAADCAKKSVAFIDLGADFRLESEDEYKEWYDGEFLDKELHEQAAYGLPELFRKDIRGKKIIANPGCYPTGAALALYPALAGGFVEKTGIIIDAKSGVTGAGRSPSQTTHFPLCNEGFAAYKIAAHRHTPEIEQSLSHAVGQELALTFVPHLLPINRGILTTAYAKLKEGVGLDEVYDYYENFYKNEAFVRLKSLGQTVNLRDVKYSNFCDLALHADERAGNLIVTSAIDNMVKGAAGQAVQNMNIIFDLPEGAGLDLIPPAF
ncbi:MAG: N-acetyl-gamma-glutamyl-phosphate reductase [Clostridiales bacterium]|nr:N-acetyl-gamma-glutamyl-phosphate reductase [Clostridiales bacterium]